MNRLATELDRLYGKPALPCAASARPGSADGLVRALVIDVQLPGAWEAVAALWHGVQDDLQLPPPALAVNGADGYQVWFALSEAVSVAQGHRWLEALRQRYLKDIPAARVRLHPAGNPNPGSGTAEPRAVPAEQGNSGRWSAFVAPGLAPLFVDDPWLDLPPSPDAQADLLLRLDSIGPRAWQHTCEQLGLDSQVSVDAALSRAAAPIPDLVDIGTQPPGASWPATADPRQFLLAVMNDASVDLALRIEAAKALLPRA